MRRSWDRITQQATSTVEGLFKDMGEEGYNPDATATRAECSMRTHVSIEIMRLNKRAESDDRADARAFGSIILQDQLSRDEWQDMRDRMTRKQAPGPDDSRPVIDVAAENVSSDE